MEAPRTDGCFLWIAAMLLTLAIVVGAAASMGFWVGQRSITTPAPTGTPMIYKPREILV